MTGRIRRAVLWAGVPLALAACSESFCTAMGCTSTGVHVTVDGFPAAGSAALSVRACLDWTCVDRSVDVVPGFVAIDIPESPRPRGGTVWVRITRGRSVLLDTATRVTLQEFAPNGEGCGPICVFADLTATPAGLRQTLVP